MLETRNLPIIDIEIRDSGAKGVAAPFGSPSHNLGGFIETIAKGAFTRSLKAAADGKLNIYALWAHDNAQPLASTRSGKLKLWETEAGLEFELDTTRMTDAQRNALEDGDLQCSFGFSVIRQEWAELDDTTYTRTLLDVDLSEISLVISPAYPDTSVALRSLDKWKQEHVAPLALDVRSANVSLLLKRALQARLKARGKL